MNPSPDNEKDHSTVGSVLQPSVQPPTYMGYGSAPQYPPVQYTPVATGFYPGPPISTPPTIIIREVQPDYLVYSILTTIFCCFPFGVAALVFSVLTQRANHNRNYAAARRNSRLAQSFNHTALGIGIFFFIAYIIIIALFFTVFNQNKTYSPTGNIQFGSQSWNIWTPRHFI